VSDNPSEAVPTVPLSYDVSGAARSAAVRMCHLVFGRGGAPAVTPPPYILRPGVVWVGQSVLLMPQPLAEELASRLRGPRPHRTRGPPGLPAERVGHRGRAAEPP